MTDFTADSAVANRQPLRLFSGIGAFFSSLAAGYRVYLAYNELNQMSDAQLTKLGLTRMDLPRAAAAPLFDWNN